MRTQIINCLLFYIFCLATASKAQITLSEIMFNPQGNENYDEFIEIYNTSPTKSVDLHGWQVSDGSDVDKIIPLTGDSLILGPNTFGLILDPGYFENSTSYENLILPGTRIFTIDNSTFGSGGLSNSTAETVSLLDSSGSIISAFTCPVANPPGNSVEKVILEGSDESSNWKASLIINGTPGFRNSVAPIDFDLSVSPGDLKFQPKTPTGGETIKFQIMIHNSGQKPAADFSVEFYLDQNGNQTPEPDEQLLPPILVSESIKASDSLLVETEWEDAPAGIHQLIISVVFASDANLTNNQISVNLVVGVQSLSVLINEIMYRPAAGSVEWVELLNSGTEKVNLKNWTFSDERVSSPVKITSSDFWLDCGQFIILAGDALLVNQFPEIGSNLLVPAQGFPALNNDGDAVVVKDFTGRISDSLFYQSSWGGGTGISLERILPAITALNPENWGSSIAESGATPLHKNSLYPPEVDLSIDSTSLKMTPAKFRAPGTLTLSAEIKNIGLNPVEAFQVLIFEDLNQNRQMDNTEELQNPLGGTRLEPGQIDSYSFLIRIEIPGVHHLGIIVEIDTDERPGNNLIFKNINAGYPKNSLVINEIFHQPRTGQPEWVELFNPTPEKVDLFQWTFQDADADHPVLISAVPLEILPNSYGILTGSETFYQSFPEVKCPVLVLTEFPALNNSSDEIVIKDLAGFTSDSVFYQSAWGSQPGVSLERVFWRRNPNAASSWQLSSAAKGASPGEKNSADPVGLDLAIGFEHTNLIRNIVNRGDTVLLQIEIKNIGKELASDFRLQIFNNQSGDSTLTSAVEEIVLSESLESGASVSLTLPILANQSGHRWLIPVIIFEGDQNLSNNFLILELKVGITPGEIVIQEIMYDPFSDQPEWIEIFNKSQSTVDVGEWYLADGDGENRIKIESSARWLLPGVCAVITGDSSFFQFWPEVKSDILFTVQSFPSLNNDQEQVRLFDMAGNQMDSVFYTSEWGGATGISVERINPSIPSCEATNWNSCVAARGGTPGAPNSIFIATPPTTATLAVTPNPFSPDQDGFNDFALISYQLPLLTSHVNLRIYDVRGRLIRDILNNDFSGAQRTVIWDGRDNQNQFARMGIYIIYLEALNEQAGVLAKLTQTVVLAHKL